MAMGQVEQQYLMSPILPRKGTAVLAGKPDTGKVNLYGNFVFKWH
jgi:hypothetical protein